ncbi:MAG: YbaB/EbfC family nucleoid-associated protein [Janthinobacterium lividum]
MTNFNQFLEQAQGMQKKMQEIQEQMANTEYEGRAGGGLVSVKVTGRGDVRKIHIDQSMLKIEEKDVLEDLIVAAFTDAKQKVDQDSQNSISSTFGGISLPPGIKF